MIAIRYFKGFIATYFYYMLLVAILYFRNSGTKEIILALILQAFFGVPLVLLGSLIIESIKQEITSKKPMIAFVGFIYGISYTVFFSGGVELDYYISLYAGLFSCIGFLIYLYFSKGKSYR